MRLADPAVDILRQAGFSPDEADEHGFYRRPWEGWLIAFILTFAAALPLAALLLG